MRKNAILHVEDDADDAFFFEDALRRGGVQNTVDVASDGNAAISYLKEAAKECMDGSYPSMPGLVILDLNLPQKHGLEVLKWIRQESAFKTVIVIILTSSNAESDMKLAYALGANSYVIKPTDATELRDFVPLLRDYWLRWNQFPREMC